MLFIEKTTHYIYCYGYSLIPLFFIVLDFIFQDFVFLNLYINARSTYEYKFIQCTKSIKNIKKNKVGFKFKKKCMSESLEKYFEFGCSKQIYFVYHIYQSELLPSYKMAFFL